MRLPGRPGCRPVGMPVGGTSGWKEFGWQSGPGAWPLVVAFLSRPVFLSKYHPHQPPQSITSPCLALTGAGEPSPAHVILRSVGDWWESSKLASPGKGPPWKGPGPFFWHFPFSMWGKKKVLILHSPQIPQGQILTAWPGFSISGRGGSSSWLPGRTRETQRETLQGGVMGTLPAFSAALRPGPRDVMGDRGRFPKTGGKIYKSCPEGLSKQEFSPLWW